MSEEIGTTHMRNMSVRLMYLIYVIAAVTVFNIGAYA